MCGIVGWITTEKMNCEYDRRRYLSQALIAGTLRGDDSTGIFLVPHQTDKEKNPESRWLKNVGDGYSFVCSKDYHDETAHLELVKWAIGHNRSATVGKVTTDGAHPFQEGPITLVHNGTLTTTYDLPIAMHELRSGGVEVDSHVIAHNLAIHPVEEVVKKLDGAYALVWHDQRDDSLNIIRNEKRPLHLMQATDQRTIYIASEAEMLHWLCARIKIARGPIYQPKPGVWMKFKDGSLLPECKQVEMYTPTYSYHGWGETHYPKADRPTTTTSGATTTSGGTEDWNKVMLGGRMRPVPQTAQVMLLDMDLEITDRLSFQPENFASVWGTNMGVVTGPCTLYGDSRLPMKGVVYGVKKDEWENGKHLHWLSRPIAVKRTKDGEYMVILKVVSSFPAPSLKPSSAQLPVVYEQDRNCPYPGPGGRSLTQQAWLVATSRGCVQCGDPILSEDAQEVEWVNNGQDPMCPRCQIEWYDREDTFLDRALASARHLN